MSLSEAMKPWVEVGGEQYLEAYKKKHGWFTLSPLAIMKASYEYVDLILEQVHEEDKAERQ